MDVYTQRGSAVECADGAIEAISYCLTGSSCTLCYSLQLGPAGGGAPRPNVFAQLKRTW